LRKEKAGGVSGKAGISGDGMGLAANGLKKTDQLADRFQVKVETGLKDLLHDPVQSETYDGFCGKKPRYSKK
jgi:hypothetical protein